jgi:hypothetical protein
MEETKICFTCGVSKPVSEFSKDKQKKDGLRPNCNECRSKKRKAEYDKGKEAEYKQSRLTLPKIVRTEKVCGDCHVLKPITDFQHNKYHIDGYASECRECVSKRRKDLSERNKAANLITGITITEKRCPVCGETLPVSEFFKSVLTKDGLHRRCKQCEHEDKEIIVSTFLEMYGGHCALCDPNDPDAWEPEFLTLDHAQGGGNQERKIHKDGLWAYRQAIKDGVPDFNRFRILCLNHNFSEGVRGNLKPYEELSPEGKRRRDLVEAVIDGYGGKCSCCGCDTREFLTIDHVNGGGSQHRREEGKLAAHLDALARNFPPDYQLRCFKCNFSKHLGEGLCLHERKLVKLERV